MTIDPSAPGFNGDILRRHRTLNKLTVRQLAARIGVSAATVSAIETGKTELSVRRMQQFAQALSIPVSALLEGGGPVTRESVEPAPETAEGDWRTFSPLPIDQLLTAAIEMFVAVGYHGASMRSICSRADMSTANAYNYYPSKQAFLVAIMEMTMKDLMWRLKKARSEGDTSEDRLQLLVEALALFHIRRKDVAFIGVSELRSLEPDNYRTISALRNEVQEMIDDAVADVSPSVAPSVRAKQSHVGNAIASMCTALSQWVDPEGPVAAEDIAREHADFALRLLFPPPAST